jgi:TPR repeat protein
VAQSARRLGKRLQALSRAIADGDAQAMWEYALLQLGLPEQPQGRRRRNELPFLTAVYRAAQGNVQPQPRELIVRAAGRGQTKAMVVRALHLIAAGDPDAEKLLALAADRGDTAAMLRLGTLLEIDDPAQARYWLARLADAGDDAGMYALSLLVHDSDPSAAAGWLQRAASAGNVHAQSDLAVRAYEARHDQLDPVTPPAADPMRGEWFTPSTPFSRRARHVASCLKCGRKTIHDNFEFIIGRWYGLGSPGTAGKTGDRVHFSTCAVCACLFPLDDASREYVQDKGADWFDPALAVPGG